eukprot:jgi/Botrbrau1/17858/Bobra.0127s0098.2
MFPLYSLAPNKGLEAFPSRSFTARVSSHSRWRDHRSVNRHSWPTEGWAPLLCALAGRKQDSEKSLNSWRALSHCTTNRGYRLVSLNVKAASDPLQEFVRDVEELRKQQEKLQATLRKLSGPSGSREDVSQNVEKLRGDGESTPVKAPYVMTPSVVDRREYEAQQKLLDEVSALYRESRMHKDYLELALQRCYEGYVAALEAINFFGGELEKWEQMLAEPEEIRNKAGAAQTFWSAQLNPLRAQIVYLKKVWRDQQESVYAIGLRKVPISYVGLANEVYLRGTFDGWGSGLRLSCSDPGNDGFAHFEGDLYVSPGRYEVKFVVDGQWRLAGEGWETVTNERTGVENNILEVL